MANREAYRQMKAEAKRLGYPEHFRDDLIKHDRSFCAKSNEYNQNFGWIVRKCGTHILIPGSEWSLGVAKYYSKEAMYDDPHFYWVVGSEMVPIDADTVVRRLADAVYNEKSKYL